MGKLKRALEGDGFPTRMPEVVDLTIPQQIACAVRILARADFALDVAGHITVMRPEDDGTMWCTPYGLWWREVKASDLLVLDRDGAVLEGKWDVTPAVFIHTELHTRWPEARVIIHNHPYYGSLLSTMHVAPEITDQQACMFDGEIALFDEYTGGVDDSVSGGHLADAIVGSSAVILANHGVLIAGESVAQATYRASNFERTCRLNYDAMAAGRTPVPVPVEQRGMLKRAINSLSVEYFWGGEIRRLLEEEPDVLR